MQNIKIMFYVSQDIYPKYAEKLYIMLGGITSCETFLSIVTDRIIEKWKNSFFVFSKTTFSKNQPAQIAKIIEIALGKLNGDLITDELSIE